MKSHNPATGAFLCVALCLASASSFATDWPTYKKDVRRSSVTDEMPEFPLSEVWVYRPAQPPRPAWPEPGRELHRIDFDYAFQPVMAGGLVYFGSSADDTVRALDATTGGLKWRFTTAGPVRFAPHIAAGNCYVASDDGFAYCLDAATGKLIWKFRAAPWDRQLIGNGRMISRWPCRTAVLAEDGIVYVTAGMWPSDGVFVYALDGRTGKQIWCNDTSGSLFMLYPHGGAYAIGGVAPQGYLLTSGDVLLVPTGRSVPAAFDKRTGRFMYYRAGEYVSSGGGWATVAGDHFFNPTHAWGADVSVHIGEMGPRPGDGMHMYSVSTGENVEGLPGMFRVVVRGNVLYAASANAVKAVIGGKVKWKARHPRVYSLALAGDALLVGGAGSITALDAADGTEKWRGKVPGQVRGIAVADGRLIAAAENGAITCFASGDDMAMPVVERGMLTGRSGAGDSAAATEVIRMIKRGNITKGYALVIGGADARLAEDLAARTDLHVISVLSDRTKVLQERERLLESTGLYGSSVAVQHVRNFARLPWADYFANVVVAAAGEKRMSVRELYRVLRPCGGMMCFTGVRRADAEKLVRQADIPQSEVQRRRDSVTVVRGKLPGAFDWDSKVTSDHRVRWPLELLWSGGPGPARMVGRHWATPTPIAANGRYFAIGEHDLIAVDAYNGCELWSRNFANLFWNVANVAADDDSVYVNFGDGCIVLDAQTGAEKMVYGRLTPTEIGPDAAGVYDRVPVHDLKDLPAIARKYGRIPSRTSPGYRTHPLTVEHSEKAYNRSHGCGGVISSATMDFFRSGTFGFYDLEDDSGLRNFAGARPGCGLTMIPALGLLIANEGSAACSCSYSFQTSLVLAPAASRRDEDWAVFHDSPVHRVTRHAALNLAAPGDRRDDNRTLWLGTPRPEKGLKISCDLKIAEGLGPYRVNADRVSIAGTDRPWIYTSGIRGLQRAALDLESFAGATSLACRRPPRMDAELDEPCWGTNFHLEVTDEDAYVMLRHDADNLYLAYRRPAAADRLGRVTPWKRGTTGDDASVWNDHSCEVFISDDRAESCVHLGVSASGARYDGLWKYAYPQPMFDVPRLKDIKIDGRADDWGQRGFQVRSIPGAKRKMRLRNNFDPSFRLGWNESGLILLIEVRDDTVIEYQSASGLWNKDSMEIFMALGPNSKQRFQLAIAPGADPKHPRTRKFFLDGRVDRTTGNLAADAVGRGTDEGYVVEVLLPWKNLGIRPALGKEVAFQILINDADTPGPFPGDWFRTFWHPDGHAGFKPMAMQRLRLALEPSAKIQFKRGAQVDRKGFVSAISTHSFPMIDIPRIEDITIDAEAGDWGEMGFRQASLASEDGRMRPEDNFDPSLRLGWCDRGVLILAQVRDQTVIEDPDVSKLWRKDSIEIFMTPRRGSGNSFQLMIGTGADTRHRQIRTFFADNRKKGRAAGKLTAEVAGRKTDDGYIVEALLPWRNLAVKAADGVEVGLQIFINDADDAGPGDAFRASWHPEGHAVFNPMAFHRVRLAANPGPPVRFGRGRRVTEGLVLAERPYPWPLPKAGTGVSVDDKSWNGEWSAAARADEKAFTVEMTIPWKTLEAAGLEREHLIIDFSRRGSLRERPHWSFIHLDRRDLPARPPRPYTVRLHFAELEYVKAGRRVFDVKLQGRVVLRDFDIVREAGSIRRAVVKEFTGITASTKLVLELVPKAKEMTEETAPTICGLEVLAE